MHLQELENGGEPFPPFQFLLTLRQTYPQFAQQNQEAARCRGLLANPLLQGLQGEGLQSRSATASPLQTPCSPLTRARWSQGTGL
eukprot:1160884-Pelagomonas_calceolata.AAC.25